VYSFIKKALPQIRDRDEYESAVPPKFGHCPLLFTSLVSDKSASTTSFAICVDFSATPLSVTNRTQNTFE
jgi:hypothetical protein